MSRKVLGPSNVSTSIYFFYKGYYLKCSIMSLSKAQYSKVASEPRSANSFKQPANLNPGGPSKTSPRKNVAQKNYWQQAHQS